MKTRILSVLTVVAAGLLCACQAQKPSFVEVKDGKFVCEDYPSHYVGTNFWYGAILGSEGVGGDRARLEAELDTLKALGMTNLRVLVGGDGPDGIPTRVSPTLQKEPGVYNDTIFWGLDYLLAEMGERNMKAVLYINNSWEWSGGYGMYLEWAGEGKALIPAEVGYSAFMNSVSKFVTNEKAKEMFYDHVRHVVSRTNTVTGKPYKDDPAIFSWQICNEPRPFARDSVTKAAYAEWLCTSATLIKMLDPNHMVSTGSEGLFGSESDLELFEKVHAHKDFDYLNIHIWPLVWRWVTKDTFADSVCVATDMTEKYIMAHYPAAERLQKPIVLEEFGYPRDGDTSFEGEAEKFWDGVCISKESSTAARDAYYGYVFDRLVKARENGEPLAGVNFWGWGGYATQSEVNEFWRPGDDYCGDPAQEPQGLFSVYITDESTVALIKQTNETLKRTKTK